MAVGVFATSWLGQAMNVWSGLIYPVSIAFPLNAIGTTPPIKPGSGALEKAMERLTELTSGQPHR